jgi:hypothetical protein
MAVAGAGGVALMEAMDVGVQDAVAVAAGVAVVVGVADAALWALASRTGCGVTAQPRSAEGTASAAARARRAKTPAFDMRIQEVRAGAF